MTRLIIDVASAPIVDAAQFIEGTAKAPAHYKDPEKIAAAIAEKEAERLAMAATDLDLARITGIGCMVDGGARIFLCHTPDEERAELVMLASRLGDTRERVTIVTYGGFNFDLPLLMRRARYLGVDFPTINLDRYRSPHLDLCELLSDRNPQRRRPLGFYVKRLGWSDLTKPLSGAEEARVHETGQWDELRASIHHDVTATFRLAQWLGVL